MNFLVSKCPMCSASISPKERVCSYCNTVLIPVSYNYPVISEISAINLQIPALRGQLKKESDNAYIHYALGVAYANKGLRDDAIVQFQKSIALEPEHPEVYFNLGIALCNEGNVALDSEEYAAAIKAMETASTIDVSFKEAQAFKFLFLAKKLEDVDFNGAIDEYKKAIDLCPDIALFWNNLGYLYVKTKQLPKAIEILKQAIKISPEYLSFNNLCVAYFESGQFSLSIDAGLKATEKITTATWCPGLAHSNLSSCYLHTLQFRSAMSAINRAIAFEPKNKLFRRQKKIIQATFVFLTILLTMFVLFLVLGINALWHSGYLVGILLFLLCIYVFVPRGFFSKYKLL